MILFCYYPGTFHKTEQNGQYSAGPFTLKETGLFLTSTRLLLKMWSVLPNKTHNDHLLFGRKCSPSQQSSRRDTQQVSINYRSPLSSTPGNSCLHFIIDGKHWKEKKKIGVAICTYRDSLQSLILGTTINNGYKLDTNILIYIRRFLNLLLLEDIRHVMIWSPKKNIISSIANSSGNKINQSCHFAQGHPEPYI